MTVGIDVEYADRAIHLPQFETLVVADLHVGRDATSVVELPMGERDDLTRRLHRLLVEFDPGAVVVAGDLLHAFGSIPDGVSESVTVVLDTIREGGADPILLAGNHDSMLDSITDESIESVHVLEDGTVIHHGHVEPTIESDRYVVGHEHPVIEIEGSRHPCFLECADQRSGAAVIVLPGFNRFTVGTPVNGLSASDVMSPLLTDLSTCKPVVSSADGVLTFPPLGEFRSLL